MREIETGRCEFDEFWGECTAGGGGWAVEAMGSKRMRRACVGCSRLETASLRRKREKEGGREDRHLVLTNHNSPFVHSTFFAHWEITEIR
jgi:hypothetical protein